jgi:UDP-N-acetylglucosamine--dolichyl-phosphate N-acetylglucosaminephosphotransferase
LFPRVPDQHKPNKPLVPNGLGVFYVLTSVPYLFFLYFFNVIKTVNGVSKPLTLAVCILFGGFMGLLDDWIDLKWRYKAFLPLIASIPLFALASRLALRTSISIPMLGTISFGNYYYFLIIPLIVTIFTNTVNQLGGLNGLETVCPAIIIIGLMICSGSNSVMLIVPLILWLILAYYNFTGRIFVGNTGSFSIGMTLTAFAIISDLKIDLTISLLPYIINSALILLTFFFFFRERASVSFDGKKLSSSHRRSLITLITYRRALTERQVVLMISLIVAVSTIAGSLIQILLTSG